MIFLKIYLNLWWVRPWYRCMHNKITRKPSGNVFSKNFLSSWLCFSFLEVYLFTVIKLNFISISVWLCQNVTLFTFIITSGMRFL